MACPIWPKHKADSQALRGESGGIRSIIYYRCPTCGEFEMSWEAATTVRHIDDDARWALSWATRNASEQRAPLRLLTADVKRTIESVVEPVSPIAKIDLLISLLGSRARSLGEPAMFEATTDWPLTFARGEAEAKRLLDGARQLGYVESTLSTLEGVPLTLKGWERLGTIAKGPSSKFTKVFVAMWFSPQMNPAFDDGFKPALVSLGYDPVRVDREEYLGKVDDFIMANIRESGLLVADFTGHRQGVYFEAGFARGLGIPVVFTCREDEIKNAHFDTRQENHITWTAPEELAKKLRARIEATIPNRPKPRA